MPRSGSIKLQIASAYLVTASRMGSWLVVSALVYRYWGAAAFAALVLVRGVVGILNYATVGIGPAVIYLATRKTSPVSAISINTDLPPDREGRAALNYETKEAPTDLTPAQEAFGTSSFVSWLLLLFGILVILVLEREATWWIGLEPYFQSLVHWFALGTLLRLCSDARGASLQVSGYIVLDNIFLSAAEIFWVVLSCVCFLSGSVNEIALEEIGKIYFLSGCMLLILRYIASTMIVGEVAATHQITLQMLTDLLAFGSIVMIAQLADYLYAPTDYLLINHLIDAKTVAVYAPAVQIDAALLLLVAGLSAVILPRSALAHAEGNSQAVRQYYVRGTLASLALLIVGALFAWLVAPLAFKAWLGNSLPATRLILPLVLIHTVIGGSSAVGRSILLGIGKARPFAAAALIAGAVNVVLSYCFVVYCGLGLRGIILGTIIAVVARCGIWMPWYVTRQLRQPAELKWEEPELVG